MEISIVTRCSNFINFYMAWAVRAACMVIFFITTEVVGQQEVFSLHTDQCTVNRKVMQENVNQEINEKILLMQYKQAVSII